MDPLQGKVICIGRNGNYFTKMAWKKRREEKCIVNPSGLHFLSEERIPV